MGFTFPLSPSRHPPYNFVLLVLVLLVLCFLFFLDFYFLLLFLYFFVFYFSLFWLLSLLYSPYSHPGALPPVLSFASLPGLHFKCKRGLKSHPPLQFSHRIALNERHRPWVTAADGPLGARADCSITCGWRAKALLRQLLSYPHQHLIHGVNTRLSVALSPKPVMEVWCIWYECYVSVGGGCVRVSVGCREGLGIRAPWNWVWTAGLEYSSLWD